MARHLQLDSGSFILFLAIFLFYFFFFFGSFYLFVPFLPVSSRFADGLCRDFAVLVPPYIQHRPRSRRV